MANVNTIKTRILNKYDLLANYTSSFIPLKGEICLVEIPSGTSNSGLTPPAVGIKVGDGSTTFDKLQWIQAIAGDVDTFVKGINEGNFPAKVKAALGYSSTDSLDTVISSINTKFASYSTTAQMNTELAKKVDTTTLTAYQQEVTNLLAGKVDNDTFTTYQGQVTAALNKKVETSLVDTTNAPAANNLLLTEKTIDGKITTVSNSINEKIGTLTNLTTTAKGNVVAAINEVNAEADANAAAIENLQKAVGTGADGLATKVTALENALPVGDFDSTNTVKKAIQTAEGHIGTVGSLTTSAKTSTVAAINELDAEIGTIANLNNKKATLVEEINAVDARVTATNGNLTTVAGQVETLIGSDTGKSVREVAAAEVAKITTGADTKYDTLKEISDWILNDTTGAADMANDIAELQGLHAKETDGSFKTVAEEAAAAASSAITNANLGQYATNDALNSYKTTVSDTYATKTEVAGTITAAGTAVQSATFAGTALTKSGTALSITKDAARSALGIGSMADKNANDYSTTTQMNTAISTAKSEIQGNSSNDTKDSATIAGAKKYADAQVAAANQSLTSEINGIKQSIEDMDYSAADNSGAMFGITQVNGKITGTTRRKIKNADLDTSDVFVFYCGNATGYDANMATVTIE